MIYLVRHGQTDKNRDNILQGRRDVPLNDLGRQQALALGQKLQKTGIRFDRVISSPLARAVETARLIAGAEVPLCTDDRLLEMDYGPYEGISLNSPPPEVVTFFRDFVHNPAPDGMEPLSAVTARMGALLEELAGSEETILLSTHAIALKGALEYLMPESQGRWWSTFIGNCDLFYTMHSATGYSSPKKWSEET